MQLCIEREQTAGLYAMWARAKSPFEKRTLRLFKARRRRHGLIASSPSSITGVPEPATWAMLVGFAGLGFAGYRASRGNILLIGGH